MGQFSLAKGVRILLSKKIETWIGNLLAIITTISLIITVSLTFLQVFYRYVLQQALPWSQEALMISFVYSVLFGAALAIKENEHLTVDIYENTSKAVSFLLKTIEFIIVGVVIIVLLYYGIILVVDNLQSGQTLSSLPIQKAHVYMALPISALFMLFFHIKKVFS